MLNFPLCIFAMTYLDAGDWKSSLLSFTIMLSYIVLISRLDKTTGYVGVLYRIIKESIEPFIIIFILLFGFLIAFRNRSIENNSSFDTIDHLNGTLPYTFFQIYFMMAGDHQTENMGIDNLTWPNSMTFFIYLVFMLLISTLTFNIFTGIAISEIQDLIDDSNIQTMKEKIDYICDGGYSIFFLLEKNKRFMKFKRAVYENVVKRFLTYLGKLRLKWFPRKKGKKQTAPVKNKQHSLSKTIEDRSKNSEEKFETRSKNLEEKLDQILNNNKVSETIETRTKNLEDKLETKTKNLEDKLDQILASLLRQKQFSE